MRAIDKLDKPGFGLKGVEDLLKKGKERFKWRCYQKVLI